jgi:hypothetical protein
MEYLPTDEPGLADWFENWSAKMDDHGAEHGFSAAEIQQAKDDAILVRSIVSAWQSIEAYRRKFSNFKNLILDGENGAPPTVYPLFDVPAAPEPRMSLLPGLVKRTKSSVRRLRTSAAYNEAVGADFRVLPRRPQRIAPNEAKPVLRPQVLTSSQIEAAFKKNGFDGIELEVQRGPDANLWTSLGRFFASPAEDATPPSTGALPEVRRYRARYLKRNKPVGEYSDIVSIITKP